MYAIHDMILAVHGAVYTVEDVTWLVHCKILVGYNVISVALDVEYVIQDVILVVHCKNLAVVYGLMYVVHDMILLVHGVVYVVEGVSWLVQCTNHLGYNVILVAHDVENMIQDVILLLHFRFTLQRAFYFALVTLAFHLDRIVKKMILFT